MPSTKKRVNLTIPDDIYDRLQAYKAKYGLANDATACLQLVVQQLNSLEKSELMFNLINQNSIESLMKMTEEGYKFAKEAIGQEQTNS